MCNFWIQVKLPTDDSNQQPPQEQSENEEQSENQEQQPLVQDKPVEGSKPEGTQGTIANDFNSRFYTPNPSVCRNSIWRGVSEPKEEKDESHETFYANFFTKSFRIKDLGDTIFLDISCFMVYT